MEREKEVDIVYLVTSSSENSEENVAVSYILQNENITSEDQVILLEDDSSVSMNNEISFEDKDRSLTIKNRKDTDVAIEQFVADILKNNSEGNALPHDQVKSSTEASGSEKGESCASNENYVVALNVSEAEMEYEQPVEKQLKAVSILKPVTTASTNQDGKSAKEFENSGACNYANNLDDCEDMEVSTQAENETLNSEDVAIEDLTCEYCQKIFSSKRERNKHIRNFHHVVFKKRSKGNELVVKQQDAVSILKPGETAQDANPPSENPLACKNVNIQEGSKEGDVDTEDEDDTRLISEGIEIDKVTCKYCLKKFACRPYLNRHFRVNHKIFQKIARHIKCIECDVTFKKMETLREHLQMTHNLNMEREDVYFPNMNAFYKWKQEVETRDQATFIIKRRTLVNDQGRTIFFLCQQSGKFQSQLRGPRKRMLRYSGDFKSGPLCTAGIFCYERANEVYVKYYRHHYAHGEQMPSVKPATEEQNVAPENESNDIPFESLLDDIRESTSADYHQMNRTKKKDFSFIRQTFSSEDYVSGLSDAESVERWIHLCSLMEDSPVLYYNRDDDEFILMIMTEFQKHILLSSDKQIVSVDSIIRHLCKGVYFYLTYILVQDECEVAFPVAFCISNKMDKKVIKQFLMCIRESTGPLTCTYFASDVKKYYYEAWKEVMSDDSKWLWSLWLFDQRHSSQLKGAFTNDASSSSFKGNFIKRAKAYKKFRMMLECQNPSMFETMFKEYVEWLQNDPQTMKLGNLFIQKYSAIKEAWAICYQKDLKLSTLISMELLHQSLKYCFIEGRKTQRLDKFIFVIMKLVRYKMLARLTNMLDTEKMDLAIDAIDKCHGIGLDISTDRISSLSDKIWLIRSDAEEEDVYITSDFVKCPELCSLRCSECDICVHMFSCSCMQNLINANLCPHIHAIVFKFLRPHFSPMNSPSPVHDDNEDLDVVPSMLPLERTFESALKKTHDVYTKIRSNKCTLSQESLNFVIQRLNDCLDICSGEKVSEDKSTNTESLSADKESAFVTTSSTAVQPPSQPFTLLNTFPPTMLPLNLANTFPTTLPITLANTFPTMLPINQSNSPQSNSRHFLVFQNSNGSLV